ncbi:MAG: murein biosynthesis integral membrane protein MurJ [Patescibacteria group bacterium]
MIRKILNLKTQTISFAALIIGVSSFFSYLLGALRDNLLANFLPNKLADVYWAAFRVPDFIYGILITGGITAAFLPVFSSYFHESQESGKRLFREIFTIFFIALAFLAIIFFFLAPFLVNLTVPGFSLEQKAQTVVLMRIMFLSPVILGLSAIFSSVLQSLNLFYAFAIAPIFYNAGILTGILVFYPAIGLPGLALGVIFGALMHLFIQVIPAIKAGFIPKFSLTLKEKTGFLKISKLMAPRVVSVAAFQINLIITTAIASTLTAGSIKIFNLSNNLYCVPVGLIGLSFATAVFPALSKSFALEQKEKFLEVFSGILSKIIFFILPLSGLIFILRAQAVRLIYGIQVAGGGYFGWWETRLTASSLGVLSLSLFAACLIPFLGRAFFALHNTKTPLKIALVSIGLNVALSFLFVWLLKTPGFFQEYSISFLRLKNLTDVSVLGLSLALSISTIFQCVFLFWALKIKLKKLDISKKKNIFLKMFLSAILASLTTYFSLKIVGAFVETNKVFGLLLQTGIAALLGVAVYLFLCLLLDIKESKVIWKHICKIIKKI